MNVTILEVLVGLFVMAVSGMLVYGAETLRKDGARIIPVILLLAAAGLIVAYTAVSFGMIG